MDRIAIWIVGDNEAALKTFEEALSILKGLGDELVINRVTLGICQVLISQFDVDRVQPMAERCLPIALKYDVPRDIHFAYHFLADCALIRGDVNTSLKTYADSLRAAVRLGDRFEIAYEIEGIAMALAGLGQDSKSIRLEAAVRAEHESLHASVSNSFWKQLKQRYLLAAEERSGSDAAAAEKQIGRSMGFEAAIEYALKHSHQI